MSAESMIRHGLRAGEYLAIDPSVVRHDEAGFFILLGPPSPENETHGSVCIVHVRGALVHFKEGGGDSYESILERVKAGLEADPKPSAVLFRIESPGGVVAGLNECVLKLRRMSEDSGIPFVAYVDEMAASAAYALSCSCEEILAPPSAVIGSIGCISTMVSQVKQDAKEGLEFRLIISGKRKADGHPHAELTSDAVKAETARNAELAAQFFALAGKARGISPKKLQSLEAAIYLGEDAKRVGLIDDVMSFDDVILGLDTAETPAPNAAPNEGNVTDRRAREQEALDKSRETGPSSVADVAQTGTTGTPHEAQMAVKLDALIKKTEASIASETDPRKRAALQSKLGAFLVAKAEMDDDKEPGKKGDKDDEDEDDEDSKAAKHAEAARKMKAKAKALEHRAKASEHKQKAAESEEEAKKCEEEARGSEEDDEEDEARNRAGNTSALTAGAAAAIASQADLGREALSRVEKLEKSAAERERLAMIAEAKATRRITPIEAKTLAGKSMSFVRDFLEMRPKPLVATTEDTLEQPDGSPEGDIPANVKALIEQGIEAQGITGDKAESYRKASVEAHRKAMSKTNGVY
jgi:ClpP class serine protease